MIEVRGVTKAFGPQRALVNVDLTIGAGEWVTLTGPNGAGKTTLLRILATLAQPSSGSVRLFGLDPRRHGAQIRRQLGYLSHRTLLYPDLSAEQNLRFYARCYGLNDSAARIAELLEQAQLTARRHDLVATFSRGMQQRLALARTLLHAPRLLLLDEPYTGLDTFAAEELTAQLSQLHGAGCTLVLATHTWEGEALPAQQQPLPQQRALPEQRVLILQRGRLLHDAPLGERAAFPALYRQVVMQGVPTSGAARDPSQIPGSTDPRSADADPRAIPTAPAAPPKAPLPGDWRQVGAILAKDLAAEV
ncbi:MAG: heme ABC exporter ATP-binding protein CcmA, partial [Anaerolineae bacterium]|nr:heme ABC exporter ATP-binding protein CcmA [Anaerolineae bacterium]